MASRKEFEKLDRLLAEQIRSLDREQRKVLKEIEKELKAEAAAVYEKYETEGRLSLATMQQYDRLTKLYDEIGRIITTGTLTMRRQLYKRLRTIYGVGFNGTMGIIETETGRRIQGIVKKEVVDRALTSAFSGVPLEKRLARYTQDMVFRTQEVVGQGIRDGATYRTMAASLSEQIERSIGQAQRIARTETHRVFESAKYDSLSHAASQGVSMLKWWLTSQDERVRSTHRKMGTFYSQNNAIPFDEDFVNEATGGSGPHPGLMGTAKDNIHCRCIMIIEFQDD